MRRDSKVCGEACKKRRAVERTRAWSERNPDKVKAMAAANRERSRTDPAWRARRNAASKAYRDAHRSEHNRSMRNLNYRKRFGITYDDFLLILAGQGGGCAICATTEPSGRGFVLDHCHDTGDVRGVLCAKCNSALGMFCDDLTLVRRAVEYMERAGGDSH